MCNLEGLKKAAETLAKGNHAHLRKQSSVARLRSGRQRACHQGSYQQRKRKSRTPMGAPFFLSPFLCFSSFVVLPLLQQSCKKDRGKASRPDVGQLHVPLVALAYLMTHGPTGVPRRRWPYI